MKVFIVWGDNGECYSDHSNWVVAIFTNLEAAEKCATALRDDQEKKKIAEKAKGKNGYWWDNTYWEIEEKDLLETYDA